MSPIPNPADMSGEARRRVYGSRSRPTCKDQRPVPISVLFGTDRAASVGAKGGFGGLKGSGLKLGKAIVTIPPCHRRGAIERPIVTLEFTEDPRHHLVLAAGPTMMSEAQFIRQARAEGRTGALLYIHGFNTPFDAGLYRSAQLSHDMGMGGAVFHFSWPAPIGPWTYFDSRKNTEWAEKDLKAFLILIAKRAGVKKISIVAHSMGNELLLATLADWHDLPATLGPKPFGQLVLAAPDVETTFARTAIPAVAKHFEGVTLYANSKDLALLASGVVALGRRRLGDIDRLGRPQPIPGLDGIDASAADFSLFTFNHNTYVEEDGIRLDLTRLLKWRRRMPHCRSPSLIYRRDASGDYWVFAGRGGSPPAASTPIKPCPPA